MDGRRDRATLHSIFSDPAIIWEITDIAEGRCSLVSINGPHQERWAYIHNLKPVSSSDLEQANNNDAPEHSLPSERRNTVLEQANNNDAPEHSAKSKLPQWVEIYPKKRGNRVHQYFRYLFMEGRKIHHIHIPGGNIESDRALGRKALIERAIASGRSPLEIEAMMKSWKKNQIPTRD